MTIKLPELSFADKVLKALGKKRGIIIPSDAFEQFGPYSYTVVRKENFLKALFRPAKESLPEGMIDIYDLNLNRRNISKATDSEE